MAGFKFLLLVQTTVFYGLYFLCGILLKFFPPRMNRWYGFRTNRALAGIDNWNMAQQATSNHILITIPIFFIISVMIKFLTDFLCEAAILYSIIDVLLLILSTVIIYFMTEDRLKEYMKEKK